MAAAAPAARPGRHPAPSLTLVHPGVGRRTSRHLSAHPSSLIPLNIFQRLARDWEAVHPYNAAQVLALPRAVDAHDAERAWSETLVAAGVGRVQVNERSFQHVVMNGELSRYPVRAVGAETSLQDHVSAELNRPFDDDAEPPFRPFLIPATAATPQYFGVVYQHWIADSAAIRMLLGEWFARLYDPARARGAALVHPDRGYLGLFGLGGGDMTAIDTIFSVMRRHNRLRRARKVQAHGARDYPVRVLLRTAPEGLIDRLVESARRVDAKVNDLFLAAAAQVCNRFIPAQRRANRPDLAVGSIVDLRPHVSRHNDLSSTFGLFLGFSEVVARPSELRDFGKLVRTFATQNRQHRVHGIAPVSLSWLVAPLSVRRLVKPHELYHFYRKEMPLMAGVSNVNLNRQWPAEYHPQALAEYWRVSPTGPMAPVVFTLTTLGSRLHLSLTYRESLLDAGKADELATEYLGTLGTATG